MTKDKHAPAFFLPFPGGGLTARPEFDDVLLARAWQAINRPENRMYLSTVYPTSWRQQKEWAEKPNTDTNILFMIWYDNQYIGGMGVHHIDYIHGTAETGTLIWEAEYRNRGIAKLAKLVLLDYIFDTLNLRQVYSRVIGYNTRSAKYSDKCGYVEVARIPRRLRFGEDLVDEVILLAERETWLPCFMSFLEEYQDREDAYRTRIQLLKDEADRYALRKSGSKSE